MAKTSNLWFCKKFCVSPFENLTTEVELNSYMYLQRRRLSLDLKNPARVTSLVSSPLRSHR
jgi:hypothetical protein